MARKAQEASQEVAQEASQEGKTVPMVRDREVYPTPHTADVHPAEVGNWKAAGWEVAK